MKFSNKFWITFGAGLIAIVVVGFFRPPGELVGSGMNRAEFWMRKAQFETGSDLVVAGDSRTLIGISPAAMQTILNGWRIYNFGFDHNAYNQEYLDAIENRLDPSSDKRSIVLGITPQTLTPEAAQWNGFVSLRSRTKAEIFAGMHLAKYLDHFKTFDSHDLLRYLRGRTPTKYIKHFGSDGWVASHKEPEDTMYQVQRYTGRFENNRVSPELVSQLLDYVSDWSSEGIAVYGMRIPTSQPMARLELEQSGFEHDKFVLNFEEAGGIWIELPDDSYHTYDGSHLDEESAKRYSAALAKEIEMGRIEANPSEQ